MALATFNAKLEASPHTIEMTMYDVNGEVDTAYSGVIKMHIHNIRTGVSKTLSGVASVGVINISIVVSDFDGLVGNEDYEYDFQNPEMNKFTYSIVYDEQETILAGNLAIMKVGN
jgi:hypothetical protein